MRDGGKYGLDHEHMQKKINQNSEFLSKKYQVGSMTSVRDCCPFMCCRTNLISTQEGSWQC